MSKLNNLYLDIHGLQSLPPSNANRDDTGSPKTAVYGGAVRARVSSQSWKRAIRLKFKELSDDGNAGYRTKYAKKLIANRIQELSPETSEKTAGKMAKDAFNNAKIKVNEKDGTTGALFFISESQINALAELAVNGVADKKEYETALNNNPSVDIALFGRMAADSPVINCDAACQVAHSISTHAVQNEYDYFTAVDDCSDEDNAGAGHLGTMEFNSSTLYRYSTVNIRELKEHLGCGTAEAVRLFTESFITSMPTGKLNSYANNTLPEIIYVTIRHDRPINLCGAFEEPVRSDSGYMKKSAEKLAEYAKYTYDNFAPIPEKSFTVGKIEIDGAEKVNLAELLIRIKEYIEDELKEVE